MKLVIKNDINGVTDAFALHPNDLQSIKIQLYLNSEIWDEAEIELTEDMSPEQFHWKTPKTRAHFIVSEDLGMKGLAVLCYCCPEKATSIRAAFARGDAEAIGGIVNE